MQTFLKMAHPAIVLKYLKDDEAACTSIKATKNAAGFDLKSINQYVVPAKGKQIVDTGLKIELPKGCYGRIAPRSGLSITNFIQIGGVIDEDYNGRVKIILFNHSNTDLIIEKGDRVAQLICEKIYYPELVWFHGNKIK